MRLCIPELKTSARFPRLDTILMIEKFIQVHDGEFKRKQLWEKLPKKMMYQTFVLTINYLLFSKKISIDREGKIGWIFFPEKQGEHIKMQHLFWKE